jgi:hypothetical protein
MTMIEFWNKFNVNKAIDIISKSWEEVSLSCMNRDRRKIWPECVKESYKTVTDDTLLICQDISNIARESTLRDCRKMI